jgi:exodeoxyribonuclease V alpha subunit
MLETQFAEIDKIFAKHFLHGEERKDCTAFLCYLLASARAGHLCVLEEENSFLPGPNEIWPEWEEDVTHLLKSGLRNLPPGAPITIDQQRIYLRKNWDLETLTIKHFHRLLEAKPDKRIDLDHLDKVLNQYERDSILTAGQAKVIKSGCKNCLTLISGGPGTGKTYTAGHLISLLCQLDEYEIVLAAPTGKAAARLQNSIQSAAGHPAPFQAKTLHSLLGVNKFRQEEPITLQADIVLVDECSMIDIKMMVKLLSSLKSGARLILLGDPYQLPPVETGNLFADFISYLTKFDPSRFNELTECLRVESGNLITLAKEINLGNCQSALLNTTDILHVEGEELLELLHAHYSLLEKQMRDIEDIEALKLFEKFRVLCPTRSGVDLLNYEMDKKRSCPYVPIILNRHAKEFDLFNGDTGLLVKGKEDYALFENKGKIPAYLLPSYELAYCLSVHKCQGSEYDQVVLVLPKGSHIFGRQALYTAITRAKRKLILWGSSETIAKMAKIEKSRVSGFVARLATNG